MTSPFSIALRFYWMPKINDAYAYDKSMANHLITRDYQIYTPPSGSNFTINYNNHMEAVKPYSYDMIRMLSASIETLTGISKNPAFDRAGGWIMIQLYYSAFFAAHSILRSTGYSMTKIDNVHIHGLDRRARDYGFRTPLGVSTGFYSVRYSDRSFTSNFTKETGGGGSHELVWKEFEKILTTISSDASGSKFSNLRAIEQLEVKNLSSILNLIISSQKGAGPWLSYMRNQTNYQHDFGVWYPYKDGADDLMRAYESYKNSWKNNCNQIYLDSKDSEMVRFVKTCIFIVSLGRENIYQLSETSSRRRNIYNTRILQMIKIAKT